MRTDLHTLNLRLDILNLTLVELARSVPAAEAAKVAEAISRRVTDRIAGPAISAHADQRVAADLAPILAALRHH